MAPAVVANDLMEEIMDLSQVGKTIDGQGFAYFQLDCVNKNVCSIKMLAEYEHLRQIDMSQNCIEDVSPLAALNHILRLNLSSNMISSIIPFGEGKLSHLMHLDLSGNKLKELPPLQMPALKTVSFARNQISTCEAFVGHGSLLSLDLSNNQLEALKGVGNMPALRSLNVSNNALTSADGVICLPALTDLDISSNSIVLLRGPWSEMAVLQTLSLASNKIASVQAFQGLSLIRGLRQLRVAANPVMEEEGVNVRHEVLIFQTQLTKIDDEEVPEEERGEAKALNDDRIEKERQRIAEEEEARRAAEEAAAEEARAAAEAAAEAAAAAEGGD